MKFLMILVAVFSLSSCAMIDLDRPAHRLAIQYAVGKFIESGSPAMKAAKVLNFTKSVKKIVDLNSIPLTEIKNDIVDRIVLSDMTPADKTLAIALVDMINEQIKGDIEKGLIKETDTIRVNAALALIDQVAALYL